MKTAAPVLALVLAFAAAPLAATTFVMVPDEALVDLTPVVVEASVVSAEGSPAPGIPSTDYLIEVERVLKGAVPGSNLIVRVPGGVGPDGIGLRIWGAPRFEPGERVVLFLRPKDDGTFRVAHLMLGAFHEARARGETVLVRSLAEAREVPAPGEAADARERYRTPRRREAFLQWIDRRAQGVDTAADYFVEASPGGPAVIVEPFTLFEDNMTGHNLRWFQFDPPSPETAHWRVNENFQPGLTQPQLLGAVADGMAVWNNDPGSDVFYAFGNPQTTSTTKGLGDRDDEFDNINSFQFEDPHDDVDSTFSCIGGGVLAIGGPWYETDPELHDGQLFHRIVGGDIVTNDGLECFFNVPNPRRLASELFGHELGHTLGLGHSCGDDGIPSCGGNPELDAALMNAFLDSDDDRGPALGSDDIAGIRHLYGNGMVGGPAPAPPSGLTAQLVDAANAVLNWNDNSTNETGFRVQQKVGAGSFVALSDLPPGTTTTNIANLLPVTTYTWRVRALGAGTNHSAFSNQVMLTTPAPVPAAPSKLMATPASPTAIDLTWQDNSSNEAEFAIEVASPVEAFHEIAVAPAGSTGFAVGGLVTGRPYSFRVRARNASGASEPSNEASATTSTDPTAPCVADGDTLCLLDGRFRVEVEWHDHINPGNNNGPGQVQTSPVGGSKTGVFSFFNPSNIELIVKALDGGPVNGHFWLFYGALSTVEYWVTVTDTETGDSNTYHNPPDELCGVGDTAAFPASQPQASQAAAPPVAQATAPAAGVAAPLAVLPAGGGTSGTCVPDATTLCLGNGRFEITVDWTIPATLESGVGTAVPGSDHTGYFWFFNDQNIELVVKLLDASTTPSANWWVFYGALSNVRYTITVLDTATALETSYVNEPGNYCGDADTASFPDVP
jgi:hypothetical protein